MKSKFFGLYDENLGLYKSLMSFFMILFGVFDYFFDKKNDNFVDIL